MASTRQQETPGAWPLAAIGPALATASPDIHARDPRHAHAHRLPSGALIDRGRLATHLNLVMHPPVPMWLVDEVEYALELAIAGCEHELVEIDSRGYTVDEAVRLYELDGLIAAAR